MSNFFIIELAGVSIGVRALHRQTAEFCSAFSGSRPPDILVEIRPDDLAYERMRAEEEAKLQGGGVSEHTDTYLETLAVYRGIADQLPRFDTLLIHGSALALDGRGYLFVADSGVGKSTHASLWRQKFGKRVVMINDDKPLLKLDGEQAVVYGTPWMGKHQLGERISAPLAGICFLHQSSDNRIEAVGVRQGYAKLLSHCYHPRSREQMMSTLSLIEKLARTTPLYDLYCNMSLSAVQTAIDGMKGKE